TQFLVHTRPSIFFFDFSVNSSNIGQDAFIAKPARAARWRPLAATTPPVEESAVADIEHWAHRPDGPVRLHFLNPGVPCSVSCAKYAAAFFAISRSIVSRAFSALRRAISICSGVTAFSGFWALPRPPISPRACWLSHLLKLAFGMPSVLATDAMDCPPVTCRTPSCLNSNVYLLRD